MQKSGKALANSYSQIHSHLLVFLTSLNDFFIGMRNDEDDLPPNGSRKWKKYGLYK